MIELLLGGIVIFGLTAVLTTLSLNSVRVTEELQPWRFGRQCPECKDAPLKYEFTTKDYNEAVICAACGWSGKKGAPLPVAYQTKRIIKKFGSKQFTSEVVVAVKEVKQDD